VHEGPWGPSQGSRMVEVTLRCHFFGRMAFDLGGGEWGGVWISEMPGQITISLYLTLQFMVVPC
jgi:hypothetical protein